MLTGRAVGNLSIDLESCAPSGSVIKKRQDTTPTNKHRVMKTAGILKLFISSVMTTWLVTFTEGMFRKCSP